MLELCTGALGDSPEAVAAYPLPYRASQPESRKIERVFAEKHDFCVFCEKVNDSVLIVLGSNLAQVLTNVTVYRLSRLCVGKQCSLSIFQCARGSVRLCAPRLSGSKLGFEVP